MLDKFYDEQMASGHASLPDGMALRLLKRDHAGVSAFRHEFLELAADERTRWLVWGLCFLDFRFRLFPVTGAEGLVPFCVSPMLVSRVDLPSGTSMAVGRGNAQERYDEIDWRPVERRIACLTEPLDLFGEQIDCQSGECAVE